MSKVVDWDIRPNCQCKDRTFQFKLPAQVVSTRSAIATISPAASYQRMFSRLVEVQNTQTARYRADKVCAEDIQLTRQVLRESDRMRRRRNRHQGKAQAEVIPAVPLGGLVRCTEEDLAV